MDIDAIKKRLSAAMDKWKDRTKSTSWASLAPLVGKSAETVRLYAVGDQFPPLNVLPTLCKELDVEPIYILFDMKEEESGFTRIGVSEIELELIKFFRKLSEKEQNEILEFTKFRVSRSPVPDNVKAIR